MARTLATTPVSDGVHGRVFECTDRSSAVLRQLDWRFLLPMPKEGFRHLVLLGGSPELAECARSTGTARRVSLGLAERRVADAVVVLYPANVDLAAAARCVEPAGVFYAEIESGPSFSRASMPGHVQRVLQSAGLTRMATYWCYPDCASRQAYVPLGAPKAVRWYVSNLLPPLSLRQEVVRAVIHMAARLGESVGALSVRRYAVTAVAGSAIDIRPALLQHSSVPAELQEKRIDLLLLTNRNRRVVMLPFVARASQPLVVLKFSRSPSRNAITENEQAVLAAIRPRLAPRMFQTVPQPHGCVQWGHLVVGMESRAEGRLLSVSSIGWRTPVRHHIADLCVVATWLTAFHRQTQTSRIPWGLSRFPQALEANQILYEDTFGLSAEEKALFADIRMHSAQLAAVPVPVVWSHADFHEGNIFRQAGHITVIDWAGAQEDLALLDLLYFITVWSGNTRRRHSDAEKLRNFHDVFIAPRRHDAIVRSAHEAIGRYMAAMEMDRRFLPMMLVLLWMDAAIHRARRAQDPGETKANRDSARLFAAYVRAMAVHRARIFDLRG